MLRFEALIITLVASVACAFPQPYAPIVNATTATTEIMTSFPYAHTEISVPPFSDTSASEEATSTEHVESSVEVSSGGFEATPHTAHIEDSVTSAFPTMSPVVSPIERTAITVTPPYQPPSPTEIVGVVSEPSIVFTEHIEYSVTPEPQNTPGASTKIPEFAHTEIAVSQVQSTALGENSSPTTLGIDIIGSLVTSASFSVPQSQPTVGIVSPGESSAPPVQGPPAVTVGSHVITLTVGFSTIIGTGSATTLVALTTNSAGQSIVVIGTSSSTLPSAGTSPGSSIVSGLGASSTPSATAPSSGKTQGSAAMSWRWKWGMEVWLGFVCGILGIAAVL